MVDPRYRNGRQLALIFLVMAWLTGNPVYDAMGSMCIGVVLLIISAFVGWRVKSLLAGRSADPEVQAAIDPAFDAPVADGVGYPVLNWNH